MLLRAVAKKRKFGGKALISKGIDLIEIVRTDPTADADLVAAAAQAVSSARTQLVIMK